MENAENNMIKLNTKFTLLTAHVFLSHFADISDLCLQNVVVANNGLAIGRSKRYAAPDKIE